MSIHASRPNDGTYGDDFRTSIVRTSTTGSEPFIFRLKGRHSEIRDLEREIVVQQEILRLEVPMANSE